MPRFSRLTCITPFAQSTASNPAVAPHGPRSPRTLEQEAVSNHILAALSERLRDDVQLLRRPGGLAAMARVLLRV